MTLRNCRSHQRSTYPVNTVDKLTVSNLLNSPTETSAWIAYLLTCSSARVSAEKLADEDIHLANAFQKAGFAHAFGSLILVDDDLR